MFVIRRNINFINSSSRLTSAYFTHLAFRSFSCTGYISWKGKLPRTPQEKTESNRAAQRLWRAKNKDAIKEKTRRYYEEIKAAVSHYQNRTGALEATSKAEAKRRVFAERKVERERQRVEIVAEGERRRAASKVETERRRVESKAESERRRAEQEAERQRQLTPEEAMLATERATRRAAKADANLKANHDSLRRKAEKAKSASRRAAEETERELRREQRAERKRHLGHQKAIRAQQRATSRAATAEVHREAARQKAAEYRQDSEYRKAVVAGEQQRRAHPDYAHRQDMRTWLLRCSQRDQFSWKTHVPVVYEDKTVKTCTACCKTRLAGSRLWWKSVVSPDTYVCHLCYAADCTRAMPRGFEDFKFGTKKHLKP